MAKKQTRRSISVSRGTYERLKAYCETNQISMSQFVERRVGDYLGRSGAAAPPLAASGRVVTGPVSAGRVQTPVSAAISSAAGMASGTFAASSAVSSSVSAQGQASAQALAQAQAQGHQVMASATVPSAPPVRTDAFEVRPTTPVPTPAPSRMSSINQPMSQAVASSQPVAKPDSDEPLLKDPDAKLTADQIFTF